MDSQVGIQMGGAGQAGTVGGLGVLFSILASVVPASLYALIISQCYEKGKKGPSHGVGAACVLCGAILALAASAAGEVALAVSAGGFSARLQVHPLWSAAKAPIAEELAKAMALLGFFLLGRREVQDARTMALRGALLGIGFSMAENVGYFLWALSSSGWQAWSSVVFLRVVVFGLWHAFYGALAGAALGWKPLADGWWRRWLRLLAGIGLATAFHSLHNASVTLGAAGVPAIMVLCMISHLGGMVLFGVLVARMPQRGQVPARHSRPLTQAWADGTSTVR